MKRDGLERGNAEAVKTGDGVSGKPRYIARALRVNHGGSRRRWIVAKKCVRSLGRALSSLSIPACRMASPVLDQHANSCSRRRSTCRSAARRQKRLAVAGSRNFIERYGVSLRGRLKASARCRNRAYRALSALAAPLAPSKAILSALKIPTTFISPRGLEDSLLGSPASDKEGARSWHCSVGRPRRISSARKKDHGRAEAHSLDRATTSSARGLQRERAARKPAHSPFGGTVAARVLRCPASVGLVEKVPAHLRKSSAYADRGTALHAAMALLIERRRALSRASSARRSTATRSRATTSRTRCGRLYAYVEALLDTPGAEYLPRAARRLSDHRRRLRHCRPASSASAARSTSSISNSAPACASSRSIRTATRMSSTRSCCSTPRPRATRSPNFSPASTTSF